MPGDRWDEGDSGVAEVGPGTGLGPGLEAREDETADQRVYRDDARGQDRDGGETLDEVRCKEKPRRLETKSEKHVSNVCGNLNTIWMEYILNIGRY